MSEQARDNPLTVSELIEKLRRFPGDALVCESNQFGYMTISKLTLLENEDVLDSIYASPYTARLLLVIE